MEKENWKIYRKISFTDTLCHVKIKLKLCDFSLQHNSRLITRKEIFTLGSNHKIKINYIMEDKKEIIKNRTTNQKSMENDRKNV